MVVLEESGELIGDFNRTLVLDFSDYRLSGASVPQSVPESSGIFSSMLLIGCIIFRRTIK